MRNVLLRIPAVLGCISFALLAAAPWPELAGESPPPATANQVSKPGLARSHTPLLERIAKEKQLTREEVEFIEAFATRLSHAVAVVAANPNKAFPVQSLAGRVRTAFLGFDTGKRAAMQKRAQALLSKKPAERQRYFGTYAAAGPEAKHLGAVPALDVELKAKFRAAVNARMKVLRSGSGKLTELLTTKQWVKTPKTWLEGGFFTEVSQQGKRQITLNDPVILNFRWRTVEEGAGQAFWQLLRASPGKPAIVLASGISDARLESEVNGRFSVDLRKFLPPKPAEAPTYYYVRVLPQLKQKISPAPEPGRRSGAGVQTKPKVVPKPESKGSGVSLPVTPQGIGSWSAPVIISYCAPGKDAWGQNIQAGEMYRKACFYLDSIIMYTDQYGPGNEEFHVAGFVQEFFPTNSKKAGKRRDFGPYFAELEEKRGDSHKFGKEAWFDISSLDQADWPRVYTAMFTIMEEDDGSSLADWTSRFWDITKETLKGEMGDMIRDILEEYKDELIKKGLELANELASLIVAAVSNPIALIVAMVVVVVVEIIISIISDMQDDFYGIQVDNLVLPFNDASYIEGPMDGRHPRGAFNVSVGLFEISEKIMFHGTPAVNSAAAFDGNVYLSFCWRFSEKTIY